MNMVLSFLSGLFLANGIPHFIHGISGKNFHNPFLHRLVSWVPSPLFNLFWGLLSFGLAIFLLSLTKKIDLGFDRETFWMTVGFILASLPWTIGFFP